MLHQPGAQEREIAFACYDYVIQQPDVEQRRSLCDTLGEHLVLRTGRRSPRRVVVNQHQLCGEQLTTSLWSTTVPCTPPWLMRWRSMMRLEEVR